MSVEDKKEMVRLYAEGWTMRRIAEKFQITEGSVYTMLKRRGVLRPRVYKTNRTLEIQKAIIERYREEGAEKIAADFGWPIKRVYYWANEMGLKSAHKNKNISSAREKGNRSVNYRFFDEWSIPMAYALGYIWADGCVYCPSRQTARRWSLSLRCISEDDYIIKGIATAMESTHRVRYYPRRFDKRWGYWSAPATGIVVTSKLLVESLINRHGILPDKCHKDLPFPEVPCEFLPHFARGYFDGDGWVANRKPCPGIGFCGTHKFMDGIGSTISAIIGVRKPTLHKDRTIYKIFWFAKRDVRTMFSWMYPAGEYIFLARKRDALAPCMDG